MEDQIRKDSEQNTHIRIELTEAHTYNIMDIPR